MIAMQSIGIIHTPWHDTQGMPIQPVEPQGRKGIAEVYPEYIPGLEDLDGFSHVILLYQFHRSRGYELRVTPFLDSKPRGLFATRAPNRPNPIGLSIVSLIAIESNHLTVGNVDMLDGTPLLDIKPYVADFDAFPGSRHGWLEKKRKEVDRTRSDRRFL